jgi:hypothetical protein
MGIRLNELDLVVLPAKRAAALICKNPQRGIVITVNDEKELVRGELGKHQDSACGKAIPIATLGVAA